MVPQLPKRAQDVPCPVGIVTIQGIMSTDIRPSELWIDLLQESNTARCFQFRLGDKLNLRSGIFLIPFIPGAKGLEREARGIDFAGGPGQDEGRPVSYTHLTLPT